MAKYSPNDGGPYITAGIVVSKDPETGIPDVGHYRFEVIDKQTMSFLALPNHRFGRHLAKARRLGQTTFQAALVIGVDPVISPIPARSKCPTEPTTLKRRVACGERLWARTELGISRSQVYRLVAKFRKRPQVGDSPLLIYFV